MFRREGDPPRLCDNAATVRTRLESWTVDYGAGNGDEPVSVPHSWLQDVPLEWEGPAVYRTRVDVPDGGAWIVFEGVSYAARVSVEGVEVARHEGIWDAFSVPLAEFAGHSVAIEVAVVKNGGAAYPVRDVASGFLPYVFHTFGGIFRDVWRVATREDPLGEPLPAPACRVRVEGRRVFVDERPFSMRGVLHWGWYPEVGHPNPPDDIVRTEVRKMLELGFNTLKCCLWIPSHRHLEIAFEEGLEVWLELPLWDPAPERLDAIALELERIVAQYRHHPNIVCWTIGCELSATPPGTRQRLVARVRELTGCPLVKDNSGGAEMYGGDPREFGDFYDFHPYCDTPYYPVVLDSLLPGSRTSRPLFLGEFNDIDVHRDLARLRSEAPYWASGDPSLNSQGVRWKHDLPRVLESSRFATDPIGNRHEALMQSSRAKARTIRKWVQESVRARPEIGGYVVTGWRDTPVSSSGIVDDWGELVGSPKAWNAPDALFLLPSRRPPWVAGGNRPGWADPFTHFAGGVHLRVGAHSESGLDGRLEWSVVEFLWQAERRPAGLLAKGESERVAVGALDSGEVGEIFFEAAAPCGLFLRARFGGTENAWPLWVVPPFAEDAFEEWAVFDPPDRLAGVRFAATPVEGTVATRVPGGLAEAVAQGGRFVLLLEEGPVHRAPFWRESAYEFLDAQFWSGLGYAEHWERFLPLSGDCTLDLEALLPHAKWVVLMNRIDTRTYAEAPVLARCRLGRGGVIATTLRPDGGLGAQPLGVRNNPSGAELLRRLMASW